MVSTRGTCLIAFLLCQPATWVVAAESEPLEVLAQASDATGSAESAEGVVSRAKDYVDNAQLRASEKISSLMSQVDGFLGSTENQDDDTSNKSWARIRLDARRSEDGAVKLKPSVKVKAELPETERQLKLLLSTEDDDAASGESSNQPDNAASSDDQNASVAIRFMRAVRTEGRINLDLGVRQREGDIQIFSRLNVRYHRQLPRNWLASIGNSYYYYNKSGFENTLSFNFRRPLYFKESITFRSYTDFNWRNGRDGAVIGQTIGLYTQFGERKSLAAEFLSRYYTSLNDGIDDRFRGNELRLRWRHNIWRPWFYYEFWPSLLWPATNDYELVVGGLARIEVIIGQR